MNYPIIAYGNPILRKKSEEIIFHTDIKQLVKDMFLTMYQAKGVGLAATQIGKNLRLFIVDSHALNISGSSKIIMINPIIQDQKSTICHAEEGCLSIPNIQVNVPRKKNITVEFYDENWEYHIKKFSDTVARIIQHEYDHLFGILHIDYAKPLVKKMIQKSLNMIRQGMISTAYPMIFQ